MNRGTLAAGLLVWAASAPVGAANIELEFMGPGYNDTTAVAPVGGNPGTTRGEQRRIATQFAADILGQRLVSTIDIVIQAAFPPESCGGGPGEGFTTIGSAGPTNFFLFLPGDAPAGVTPNVFYPQALANALANEDLDPSAEIDARFNASIDRADCLGDIDWYYGLDGEPGNDISFIEVAVHEFIHGLGFLTLTNLETGALPTTGGQPRPDVFATRIRDLSENQLWPALTNAQRANSATNDGNVVWDGPSATSTGAPTLSGGTNQGRIQLYAPDPLEDGSSVSHWDTALLPNALMEPFATADVSALGGIGLSACVLQDIGWQLTGGAGCPDNSTTTPTPGTPGNPGVAPASGGGGGGGGGCALGRPGAADPLLWLMGGLALIGVARRRAASR